MDQRIVKILREIKEGRKSPNDRLIFLRKEILDLADELLEEAEEKIRDRDTRQYKSLFVVTQASHKEWLLYQKESQ